MNSSRWPWIIIGFSGLFALLVAWEPWPPLRGPQGWRWPLIDNAQPPWQLLATAVLFVIGWWLLGRWERRLPALAALTALAWALQLAVLTPHPTNPAAILYERLASDQASGYFTVSVEIDHLPTFLREYPERMPQFRPDPHPRSKPPGIVLSYWLLQRTVERLPIPVDAIGSWARGVQCHNLWLALQTNAALTTNLAMALLTPLLSALALWPAFGIGRRLLSPQAGWLAAGLAALLPGRLIFAPHMDTIYPLLALTALYFTLVAVQEKRPFFSFLAGLIISLATYFSLVNGFIAVVIGLTVVAFAWPQRDWRLVLRHGAAITTGTLTIWLLTWALTGVTLWDIYLAAAPARHDLARSYGVWLWGNVYDTAVFAGLPAFLLGLTAVLRTRRTADKWPVTALWLGFWLAFLLIDLSGTIRGEVGRIWLMLAPFPALLAAVWAANRRVALGIVTATAVLVVAIGARWQTTLIEWPPAPTYESLAALPIEATPTQSPFGGVDLAGFETAVSEQLDLTLYWRVQQRPAIPYKVFVHVLDTNGNIVTQRDKMPHDGALPTTCWQPNTLLADTHTLPLTDLPPGVYTIVTGLYDERDNGRPGEPATLSTFEVP